MSVHETADLRRWTDMFPLSRLRQEARAFVEKRAREQPSEYPTVKDFESHVETMGPGGDFITSPHHLAMVEQLRAEVFSRRGYPTVQVPTDVFIFGQGEPPRPDTTKLGGIPYRLKKHPWPKDRTGKPMTFIGQLNFADSRELVGDLPGDILLIFAASPDFDPTYHFEWVKPIDSKDLLGPEGVPQLPDSFSTVYGVRHRSADFPESRALFADQKRGYALNLLVGTKIGGVPMQIQEDMPVPEGFLATIGSIQPSPDQAYPFVNVAEPIPLDHLFRRRDLMFGDMGCLYLGFDGRNVEAIEMGF